MESTIRGRQPWLLHFLALLLVLFLLPVHAPRGAQTPPKFLELDARQARLFSRLEEWLSADELERLIQDAEPFTVLVATRDPMSASALRLAMNLVSGLKLSDFEVRVLKNISRRRGRTLAIVRTHGMPSVALANMLRKSDLFDEVSLDMHVQIASVTPSDPLFDDLWGLHNEGQQGGQPDADIDAPEAWDITTGNGESIIAIIDSGIHYRHPDLADNIWTNPGEICDNGIDDDDNGYVDDCHGIDVVNDDGDPVDDNGHGTHVAGTIAAVANNGIGIAGINWNAKLLGCKFITAEGGGALSGAIECLDYLIGLRERGINIVASNNSWGSPFRVPILEEAIRASVDAGIAFITAAGNDGVDIESAGFYPCSFPVDGLICVAATDREDRLADFSSRGAVSVDVAAPGDAILSTVPEVEMIPLDRFREDAEGGGLRWKTYSSNGVNWHRSLLESRSPTHSWAAGDADGRLVPGQVSTLELDQDIDLSDLRDQQVYFRMYLMSGVWSYADYMELYFSGDGGRTWELDSRYSGLFLGEWRETESVIANRYKTAHFRIRLVVHAGSGKSHYGFFVDDMGLFVRRIRPGYAFHRGTSMATPHVTGAYSLLAETHPGADITELKDILIRSSDPVEGLENRTVSGGRINLAQALDDTRQPRLRLSTESLYLGDVAQDVQSPAKNLRIRNVGRGELHLQEVRLEGAQASAFSIVDNGCSAQLGWGGECRVGVALRSSRGGLHEATLLVRSDDPARPAARIAVSGYVIAGEIGLEGETPIDFGALPAGKDEEERKVRLRNVGEGGLEIDAVNLGGDAPDQYRIVRDGCSGRELSPRKSCEIRVRYAPTAHGRHAARLEVVSDDPMTPVFDVPLTGRGLRTDVGAIGLEPMRLAFPETETIEVSSERKVKIRNLGYGLLEVRRWTLTGSAAADFRVERDDCTGRTLKRGKRCEMKLRFAPVVPGQRNAELRIESNDPELPVAVVALAGTAVKAPPGNIRLDVDRLVFSPTPVGSDSRELRLSIRNDGPGKLLVRDLRITGAQAGEFRIVSDASCRKGALKRNKRCDVKLRFHPERHGLRTARLEITSSDEDDPVASVILEGRGLRTDVGTVGTEPALIGFGDWGPGETSKRHRLEVRNIGYGPLHLDGVGLSGADAGDFKIEKDGCSGRDLERGKRCELTLRFSGGDAGIRSAALDIHSNDPDRPTLSVPLHGRVVPHDIGLDARNHDFGHVSLGKRSDSRRFRVRNRGLGMLAIDRVALVGEHAAAFVLDGDKCSGRTLKPGKTCEVKVRFRPVTAGDHRALLTIESNDPDEPRVEIHLSGRGLAE